MVGSYGPDEQVQQGPEEKATTTTDLMSRSEASVRTSCMSKTKELKPAMNHLGFGWFLISEWM